MLCTPRTILFYCFGGIMQTDLISFLRDFYGISIDSNITHEDIKILFPNIQRCKYELVTNEELYRGNIVGVYDKNKVIIYYYNPHIIIDNIENEYHINMENKEYDISNISHLSKDELLRLRKKLRLLGEKDKALKLTNLIRKKKKLEPKEYKIKKEKLKIKESYYD